MAKSLSHKNRGKPLEVVVMASQNGVVRLVQTSAGAKKVGEDEAGKDKIVMVKGPVDFVGTVVGSGWSIHFDAKQSGKPQGFYLNLLKPHQEYHLALQWQAGAIAGVVAECTAPAIQAFFWISNRMILAARRESRPLVPWAAAHRLGDSLNNIDFSRVIDFAQKEPKWTPLF